jgi:hypothetical protein
MSSRPDKSAKRVFALDVPAMRFPSCFSKPKRDVRHNGM